MGETERMRRIAVVTDSQFRGSRPSMVGEIIRDNLLSVFAHRAQITCRYIDRLKSGDVIDDDLVMVMAGSRIVKIRGYVSRLDAVIVAKRTFSRSSVLQLFSIPKGSDVLVVNDDIETVLDSISSLYHIGLKHVNLIPFEAGKEYRSIEYALSPSEPELIPEHIPHRYDVGSRVVDIPTMLLVSSMLQINDRKTQQNLYRYYQEILSPNEGVIENYNTLLTRTEELDLVLDLSHEGIVLTDPEGKLIICNRQFRELFETGGGERGKFLHEIISAVEPAKWYGRDECDDLITVGRRIISVEKKDVLHFNQEKRMYFSFQEVTHIKKLEQNLSRKLRQKGQTARYTFSDIVFSSREMGTIIAKAEKIARTDLTVLITGESGTGKEILAQAIHNASNRRSQPFIAVNSAAIPDNLIESELFGYASGSFTGALKEGKKGLFERANNGTVFLDEIGDMPGYLQSKLLRVLQERQISPVGSDSIIDIDIRVIAATHKSPMEMIHSGLFRKDLFYRLNVFPLELPALRDRREDILLLLQEFTGRRFSVSPEAQELLLSYDWPGNIRELHNIGQYIATVQEGGFIGLESLPYYLVKQYLHRRSDSTSVLGEEDVPFSGERTLLEQKVGLERALSVLNAVHLLNGMGRTAGRKHVLAYLAGRGEQLTEGRLKTVFSALQQAGFISARRGRGGSVVTYTGELFLQEAVKRELKQA
jgi:sigma-54 dependent transcriptional regulator, acetoin dehydrogenase operon transcriptional activator AcoR